MSGAFCFRAAVAAASTASHLRDRQRVGRAALVGREAPG
jgi:hypothetical protein